MDPDGLMDFDGLQVIQTSVPRIVQCSWRCEVNSNCDDLWMFLPHLVHRDWQGNLVCLSAGLRQSVLYRGLRRTCNY